LRQANNFISFLFARNIIYIDNDGGEHFYTLEVYPDFMSKKVTLFRCPMDYMKEHLRKTGANIQVIKMD
jgi:polo-like kinase 1